MLLLHTYPIPSSSLSSRLTINSLQKYDEIRANTPAEEQRSGVVLLQKWRAMQLQKHLQSTIYGQPQRAWEQWAP